MIAMKKLFVGFCFISILSHLSFSQNVQVYPSNWWVGMKWNNVQLMLYQKDAVSSGSRRVATKYPGIKVLKVTPVENKNYLFADIEVLPTTKAGRAHFDVYSGDTKNGEFDFELKPRRRGNGTAFAQGVT